MKQISIQLQNPLTDIRGLYAGLDAPVCSLDCGKLCAPHNPTGKPFCCDICQAVPAAYTGEWQYLEKNTTLWQPWRGDECAGNTVAEVQQLQSETPEDMLLLACLGPAQCQRGFRALSCRQFPFFPYVSSDYRFLGLAYDWEFEDSCWVIQNLQAVTDTYRQQFVDTHDRLFAYSQEIFESYQIRSEELRAHFMHLRRRFPLLHRNGRQYLVSPGSERRRLQN